MRSSVIAGRDHHHVGSCNARNRLQHCEIKGWQPGSGQVSGAAAQMAPRALQREALKILRLLEWAQGWLAMEQLSAGQAWKLFTPAGAGATCRQAVAEPVVQFLLHEGLVEADQAPDCSRYRISRRGVHWLRRHGVGRPCAATAAEDVESTPTTGEDGDKPAGRKRQRTNAGNEESVFSSQRRDVQRLMIRDAETGALREVAVNVKENPLMWLARRKDGGGRPYLEPHHVAAGEKLRREYEVACMQPKVTASWNPALVASDRGRLKSGPRDPYNFAEHALAAREKVHAALDSIGDDLADIVVAVCCLGHGIEGAERVLKWPRRSARLVLRIALERLATHYGISPAQRRGQAQGWRQVLHWHAPQGRPTQLVPDEQDTTRRETSQRETPPES